jgi:predicted enzyme related to lactoylglutathione lyase
MTIAYANFATVIAGMWPDPTQNEANTKWVRDYYDATAPLSEEGGYVNFMADDDQDRIRANYKGNYDRLVDVERNYDPDNVFRVNQNIKPMTSGVPTVIYPVKDLARAKALYGQLLGVEPYADEPYYVGFRVGDQELGLDPNGHSQGMTAPVGYWEVDDIEETLKRLVEAGAEEQQAIKDVGGGKLIARVKDADGNITGLAQSP